MIKLPDPMNDGRIIDRKGGAMQSGRFHLAPEIEGRQQSSALKQTLPKHRAAASLILNTFRIVRRKSERELRDYCSRRVC